MAAKTQVYLLNFFVYNPTYGKREDEEHKKIIYYYPEDAEQDVKLRNVGLCEALVNFTQTFSPSKPCEVLHTQKTSAVLPATRRKLLDGHDNRPANAAEDTQ
ncbi:hypothetical protein MTO96_051207 [Rhipicephalus appendiculatus]